MTSVPLWMLVLGAVCALLACVDQRRLWSLARHWADSHPGVEPPGEAHCVLSRMCLVVGALLAIGLAVWFSSPTDKDVETGARTLGAVTDRSARG
ncbi:hypothetical protein [Streptomyces sp. B6B3]|uniref:hypothetical protein n=1 Tax=Streptomyces sp. B6B3 TaxID=3153570 RepID=UPI00325ED75E